MENSIHGNNEAITYYKDQISQAHTQSEYTSTQGLISRIESLNYSIKQHEKNTEDLKSFMAQDLIILSELATEYRAIHFVPKRLDLTDCNDYSKNQLKGIANRVNEIGLEFLPNGTFAKIQDVQDQWFNATHQHSELELFDQEYTKQHYEKLKVIIKVFLGTTISRNKDGNATLFGRPLGEANLSDGQKILLQFCLAIYSQEVDLKDLILIMDEPENHLHPSAIIEIIERIKDCVPNGQIWIATHSIPILAHFDPSLIWFVENGRISYAGKIPEKVLSSLLGDEDEIIRLQDFISLPAQYATSRYAFESLLEPTVVITDSNDRQSYQIRKNILSIASGQKLRILDFGAGKGRLISNIVEQDQNQEHNLIEKIDYVAFDLFNEDKEYCEAALVKAYGTSEKRYFNDFKSLLSSYDKGSFDVVIMCNVLHEIDPKQWLQLFKNDGDLSKLLKDEGVLLLVEDQQIPTGEKAYQKGFLVLDTPQLKELFKIKESDKDFIPDDQKGDGRLKSHQIPKRCLIQIDSASRKEAIQSLSDTARSEILRIRELAKSYKNGKLHGFGTQQFANAQLNLAELSV